MGAGARLKVLVPELPLPALISVIIPTLDEEVALGPTLDAVACLGVEAEVIVADGGSRDATEAVARDRGARVLRAPRGRGPQMRAGARAARGDVLWFVHADTRPAAGAGAHIRAALRRPGVVGGHFCVCFDGPTRAARLLTRLNPVFNRFGLCYGDSALFVRRQDYEAVGGFRPWPLFEDLDLVSRLRARGHFVCVAGAVAVSSRRFEGRNFALVLAGWAGLQGLYWLGVPPTLLARPYRPIRGRGARPRD